GAALHGGRRHPEHAAIARKRRGEVGHCDVDAVGAEDSVWMLARSRDLGAALHERRQMLDEEQGQGFAWSQHGELPGERSRVRGLPGASRGVPPLDPALAHGVYVGREIVTLHDHEAKAPAPVEEADEAALGAGREIRGAIADTRELEIVVAVEGDG